MNKVESVPQLQDEDDTLKFVEETLRRDALVEIALIQISIGIILILFVGIFSSGEIPILLLQLLISTSLAVGSIQALVLREKRPSTAWSMLVVSLTIALVIAVLGFPNSPARYFFPVIIFISSFYLSPQRIVGIAAGLSGVIFLIGWYQGYPWFDSNGVLGPIGLVFLSAFTAWLSVRQLRQELSNTRYYHQQRREMLQQLRVQRADLTRSVEALEYANARIEEINRELETRSAALARGSAQLEAAGQVARDAISFLDVNELLSRVTNLISERFGYYHTAIYLFDQDGEWAVIRAASSEEGRQLVESGHSIRADSASMVGFVTARLQPRIIRDISTEDTHYELNPVFSQTRSEITLPLRIRNQVLGALDVHSKEPNAFSEQDATVLQTMADGIAISIQNARLYRQAQIARAEAEEADRLKTEFLAHMSHELRTPMNAILNFTAFVADGLMGDVNETQVETLQKVISSGTHLLSLINDVLDISKIEAGMMNLFIEEVDLNAILDATLSIAKGLTKEKPVEIIGKINEKLPVISGDKRRIRQIFLNLVSNAVKFTPNGSITISAEKTQGKIHISVADTGVGIAPEDVDLVFESFQQAHHDLPNVSGTGLGLPITKHFVEAHGGQIWLESEPGKGTTFHVTLPVHVTYVEKNGSGQLIPK